MNKLTQQTKRTITYLVTALAIFAMGIDASASSKTLRLISECDKWHHRVVKLRARGKLQERHLKDYRNKVIKESEILVSSESERCLKQMRRFHKNVLWGW